MLLIFLSQRASAKLMVISDVKEIASYTEQHTNAETKQKKQAVDGDKSVLDTKNGTESASKRLANEKVYLEGDGDQGMYNEKGTDTFTETNENMDYEASTEKEKKKSKQKVCWCWWNMFRCFGRKSSKTN